MPIVSQLPSVVFVSQYIVERESEKEESGETTANRSDLEMKYQPVKRR